MKILHLLQSNHFSGAENVVCQTISLLKDNADFVYSSCDGQIKNILAEKGITFKPMKKKSLLEIKRVIKEEKPDIIHAHDVRAGFLASLCCGKIPLIFHIHNNAYASRTLSLKSLLFYLAAKKSKHILYVSNAPYTDYKFSGKFKHKSSVLYNVIEPNEILVKEALDRNTYGYDVIFLGRISHAKNPERLITVLEKLIANNPKIKIAIVGTGKLDDKIKQLASEKRLDNIDFLGFMKNPYKILSSSKVMIITSFWEGRPMCALEAMALGVPIVSTPTDGMKDLVDDGVTGFMSDDDNIIVARLNEICNNPELRATLSENSKNRFTRLNNPDNYRSSIAQIYNQVNSDEDICLR